METTVFQFIFIFFLIEGSALIISLKLLYVHLNFMIILPV